MYTDCNYLLQVPMPRRLVRFRMNVPYYTAQLRATQIIDVDSLNEGAGTGTEETTNGKARTRCSTGWCYVSAVSDGHCQDGIGLRYSGLCENVMRRAESRLRIGIDGCHGKNVVLCVTTTLKTCRVSALSSSHLSGSPMLGLSGMSVPGDGELALSQGTQYVGVTREYLKNLTVFVFAVKWYFTQGGREGSVVQGMVYLSERIVEEMHKVLVIEGGDGERQRMEELEPSVVLPFLRWGVWTVSSNAPIPFASLVPDAVEIDAASWREGEQHLSQLQGKVVCLSSDDETQGQVASKVTVQRFYHGYQLGGCRRIETGHTNDLAVDANPHDVGGRRGTTTVWEWCTRDLRLQDQGSCTGNSLRTTQEELRYRLKMYCVGVGCIATTKAARLTHNMGVVVVLLHLCVSGVGAAVVVEVVEYGTRLSFQLD
ncbi:hypothetical protein BC629DRAFT_1445626 [Irpex lacteus]|nr:hypothetical protein BC629DRAFT_1445626 [Irpex lacteus]